MLTRLRGATVYDPANGVDGLRRDVFMHDGRIAQPPENTGMVDHTVDVRGCAIMAGGIDMHTHIGGGKVNIARMMLPEDHQVVKSGIPGLKTVPKFAERIVGVLIHFRHQEDRTHGE